jgi:hypothetical protein
MRWLTLGRSALVLSAVTGLGLAIRTYASSPERVPVHYAVDGTPDRWGSPMEALTAHSCLIGLGSAFFLVFPAIIRRAPKWMINLPNREYWLSPEHRDVAAVKAARWSYTLGTAVNVVMSLLQLLLSPGENGFAVRPRALTLLLLGFVLFTLGSCIWLLFSFELPARRE